MKNQKHLRTEHITQDQMERVILSINEFGLTSQQWAEMIITDNFNPTTEILDGVSRLSDEEKKDISESSEKMSEMLVNIIETVSETDVVVLSTHSGLVKVWGGDFWNYNVGNQDQNIEHIIKKDHEVVIGFIETVLGVNTVMLLILDTEALYRDTVLQDIVVTMDNFVAIDEMKAKSPEALARYDHELEVYNEKKDSRVEELRNIASELNSQSLVYEPFIVSELESTDARLRAEGLVLDVLESSKTELDPRMEAKAMSTIAQGLKQFGVCVVTYSMDENGPIAETMKVMGLGNALKEAKRALKQRSVVDGGEEAVPFQ